MFKHAQTLIRSALLFAAVASAIGCGRGAGDLVAFDNSGCKGNDGSSAAWQGLFALDSSEGFYGLSCVAWTLSSDGDLKVDMINIPAACGASYEGAATVAGPSAVELRADNPSCDIAGCGVCFYDWSFEVEGISAAAPLALTFVEDSCPDEPGEDEYPAQLPVDMRPEGTLCRWLPPMAYEDWGPCGTLHHMCAAPASVGEGEEGCDEGEACEDGLACELPDGIDTAICLQACTTDADCPLAELSIFACVDQLCQISSVWPGPEPWE